MMTGSFMSKDSRMTCFITENLEALIFELTLRRLRMCGKKDLLIYFFDIPQRHVSRQCGGYVLDRHGDLAVPLVPDVAALDPGEHPAGHADGIASGQVDVLRCHDLDMLVACRHDRHEIPHLVVRYHRRRLRLPIHDVADRQSGAGLDLLQAQGRSADEQQVVDERLPDLARPLPVCPPGEVHRDIALHADAVQIALYEHLAAVGDAQCVPALFVFRIFSHGHTLGTPPHGCGCQAMK